MPFRYNRRRRIIRRRRIPYAIPPREVVRKFSLVLPARQIGTASNDFHRVAVNNPIRPASWTTLYSAGSQPAGLDFWLGNSTTPGPYQSAVVTYAKTKHTVWRTASTAFGLLHFYDNSVTGTFATSPSIHSSRPGVRSVIINDNTDQKPITLKRKIDTLRVMQLDTAGDAFNTGNYLFARTTQPSFFVYDWVVPYNVSANTYLTTATDLYCVTKITFWIHMRLTDMSKYDDIV